LVEADRHLVRVYDVHVRYLKVTQVQMSVMSMNSCTRDNSNGSATVKRCLSVGRWQALEDAQQLSEKKLSDDVRSTMPPATTVELILPQLILLLY